MALPSRRSACLLLLLYDYFVFFFLISAFLFYLSRFVFHVISPLFFLSFLRLCFYFIFTQISSFSHSTKSIFLLRIFISVPLYIISIISFMCLLFFFFYSVTNLSPHLSTCVDVCFLVCLRACSSNPRFICLWPFPSKPRGREHARARLTTHFHGFCSHRELNQIPLLK